MSNYTSIILLVPRIEDELIRMEEVNCFQLSSGDLMILKDLNDLEIFPRFTYIGTYNNFELDKFLLHLQNNVAWEYPEFVQLIVQVEGARNCRIYSGAGKIIVEDFVYY